MLAHDMPVDELHEWAEYFAMQAEAHKKIKDKSRAESRNRRPSKKG